MSPSFASAGMDGKVCIACIHVCQFSILHFALTLSVQIVLWDQHCGRRRVQSLVVFSSSFAHANLFFQTFHLQVWDTMNPELFDSGDSAAPSGMSAPPPKRCRQFAFDFLILQASTHPWRLMFSGCAPVMPPLSVC